MRKITSDALDAFIEHKPFKRSNTEVIRNLDKNNFLSSHLLLHGNEIAKLERAQLHITLAGWNSPTTRERLNGLSGVRIRSNKGELTLNGHPWNGEWVNVEDFNRKMKNND